MAGLVIEHLHRGRIRQASELASEAMALVESFDDPTLTVGLSIAACAPSFRPASVVTRCAIARWHRPFPRRSDHSDVIIGSPLTVPLTFAVSPVW